MRRPLARSLVLGRPGLFYGSAVRDYLDRVRAADGGGLSRGVTNAINTYISGLISANLLGTSEDVISQAASTIKAHCILAGANTLSGALVPVVGPTSSNVNFVPGDYSPKNGLGSVTNATKYLNSGYAFSASQQDNCHCSVFITTVGSTGMDLGAVATASGVASSGTLISPSTARLYNLSTGNLAVTNTSSTGFRGITRAASASFTYRVASADQTANIASAVITHPPFYVLARNNQSTGTADQYSNRLIRSYTIGNNLDLTVLQSLQDQLFAALNTAIP